MVQQFFLHLHMAGIFNSHSAKLPETLRNFEKLGLTYKLIALKSITIV